MKMLVCWGKNCSGQTVRTVVTLFLMVSCVQAETLLMTGPGNMTLHDVQSGENRICTLVRTALVGAFNNLHQATVTSITIDTSGACLVVVPPSPSGNLVFPLPSPLASSRIPFTYIAVQRVGALSGSLSVAWVAKFPSGNQTGLLAWPAGVGGSRFIQLQIYPVTASTSVPITAGGASATLTVLP